MGNPGYTAETPKRKISEEFVAWLNSVEFVNNNEAVVTMREILAEATLRLNDLLVEEAKDIDKAEAEGSAP